MNGSVYDLAFYAGGSISYWILIAPDQSLSGEDFGSERAEYISKKDHAVEAKVLNLSLFSDFFTENEFYDNEPWK